MGLSLPRPRRKGGRRTGHSHRAEGLEPKPWVEERPQGGRPQRIPAAPLPLPRPPQSGSGRPGAQATCPSGPGMVQAMFRQLRHMKPTPVSLPTPSSGNTQLSGLMWQHCLQGTGDPAAPRPPPQQEGRRESPLSLKPVVLPHCSSSLQLDGTAGPGGRCSASGLASRGSGRADGRWPQRAEAQSKGVASMSPERESPHVQKSAEFLRLRCLVFFH